MFCTFMYLQKIMRIELKTKRNFLLTTLDLLKIPSISADPHYKGDIKKQQNG